MSRSTRRIVLASRPKGKPELSDFETETTTLDDPGSGQVLVETRFCSVDPYMRGILRGGKSYIDSVKVGGPIPGGSVGVVLDSNHPDFNVDDPVLGGWGWAEAAVVEGDSLTPVDTDIAPMSAWLGVMGMPGMTAYFGLLEVGRPRPGDRVFITGAAGAVGSTVGQIARLAGCRVSGCAGTDEKVRVITDELGFDDAFNYKTADDPLRAIRQVCPDGVDLFFDNTGGPFSDAVFPQLNERARVVVCGQIDQYNATDTPTGPRLLWHLIVKRVRAEGLLVFDYQDRYDEARRRIGQWIKQGKLTWRETVVEGLEKTPEAFIGLFDGDNIGKQVVKV
ncbi:MAG: NADP-dependent oxidoreductase [Planctomycetota bacterium]